MHRAYCLILLWQKEGFYLQVLCVICKVTCTHSLMSERYANIFVVGLYKVTFIAIAVFQVPSVITLYPIITFASFVHSSNKEFMLSHEFVLRLCVLQYYFTLPFYKCLFTRLQELSSIFINETLKLTTNNPR